MATVIIGIGIPASGKTSILKDFAVKNSFIYINIDDIKREKLSHMEDHSKDKEIWHYARGLMKNALEAGQTVVFDSTFSKPHRRAHFIQFARNAGATKIEALYFDVPLGKVIARNFNRGIAGGTVTPEEYVRESYENLHKDPPGVQEGFDTLLRIDESGAISEFGSAPDSILLKHFLLKKKS